MHNGEPKPNLFSKWLFNSQDGTHIEGLLGAVVESMVPCDYY